MEDKQIDIMIQTKSNGNYTFKTRSSLQTWLDNESKIWSDFMAKVAKYTRDHANNGNLQNFISQVNHDIQQTQIVPFRNFSQFISSGNSDDYEAAKRDFLRFNPLISTTVKGQKVLEHAEEEIGIAMFLLSFWNTECIYHGILSFNNHPQLVKAYRVFDLDLQNAYVEARLFEKGFKGSAKPEKAALEKIRNDADAVLGNLSAQSLDYQNKISEFQKAQDSVSKRVDTIIEKKMKFSKGLVSEQIQRLSDLKEKYSKDIDALKNMYQESFAMEIPVTYWSDKAKEHHKAAYFWGLAFLVIIAVFLFFSPFLFKTMISEAQSIIPNSKDSAFVFIFLITLPAFLAVWVLRILSKNMLTNFNHMHDAKNRAVMTETFLALMSVGKADEKDRILILNALFQPVNGHSDDGSPPHWFEIMMERMK